VSNSIYRITGRTGVEDVREDGAENIWTEDGAENIWTEDGAENIWTEDGAQNIWTEAVRSSMKLRNK
jgi:hypothetical protein